MTEYNGFKYWPTGSMWRIQYPSGFKTPPMEFASEAEVKARIDEIIAAHV